MKPLCNVACILFVVWALYAVSAVQLYADVLPERLASFSLAATTSLQVGSGDECISIVVRPPAEDGAGNG